LSSLPLAPSNNVDISTGQGQEYTFNEGQMEIQDDGDNDIYQFLDSDLTLE
jgi:hypothetical protein